MTGVRGYFFVKNASKKVKIGKKEAKNRKISKMFFLKNDKSRFGVDISTSREVWESNRFSYFLKILRDFFSHYAIIGLINVENTLVTNLPNNELTLLSFFGFYRF